MLLNAYLPSPVGTRDDRPGAHGSTRGFLLSLLALCALLALPAFAAEPEGGGAGAPIKLRVATTTSTADSGLLDAILPAFESVEGIEVDVVAVGTGQALALGRAGDADVLLVHALEREKAFIDAGHGTRRFDIMYNDFVIVGPASDPAGIRDLATAGKALHRIAASGATFASRGDDSGTHSKELKLWEQAGVAPGAGDRWYRSLGQGMGATLQYANEIDSYTITDRATFLAQRASLPHLQVLVGGASIAANPDSSLFNPYGLVLVSPDKPGVAVRPGLQFAQWLTAAETQQRIAEFGLGKYGQALFYPNAQGGRGLKAHPEIPADGRAE